MKIIRVLKLVVSILCLLMASVFYQSAFAKQVSGSIERPQNYGVDQTLDVRVFVTAFNSSGQYILREETAISILQASTSSAYSVDIDGEENGYYVLSYSCSNCEDIVTNGYFSTSGTQVLQKDGERLLESDDLSSISFPLLAGLIISGELSRPMGAASTQAISPRITVEVRTAEGSFFGSYSDTVNVGSSERSASYSIAIPPLQGATYTLAYSCFNCDGIVQQEYLTTEGFTTGFNNATRFDVGDSGIVLNLEMIAPLEFTGSISRPIGNDNTLLQRISVYVEAYSSNGSAQLSSSEFIDIPAGESSMDFSIGIAPDEDWEYVIRYQCFNCVGIASYGYYGASGTVIDRSLANVFTFDSDVSDINMGLLLPRVISGKVLRPAEADSTSPLNALIDVYEYDADDNFLARYERDLEQGDILLGEQFSNFQIEVPPGNNRIYRIRYRCFCNGVVTVGWFNSAGTVLFESEAEKLNDQVNLTDLMMEMVATIQVSGNLFRPSGASLETTVKPTVKVIVYSSSGVFYDSYRGTFNIEAGETAGEYAVDVPYFASGHYLISYTCSGYLECDDIADSGYYRDTELVDFESEAQLLGADDGLSSVNMQLLAPIYFSGTLSRPAGVDNSQEIVPRLEVEILSPIGNVQDNDILQLTIPAGEDSSEFEFQLPRRIYPAQYRLAYSCSDCPDIYSSGVYSTTGTVYRESNAVLPVSGDNLEQLNFEMLKASFVTAKISRPLGSDTDNGIQFRIGVKGFLANGYIGEATYTSVLLPAGSTFVELDVAITDNAYYNVSYSCDGGCESLLTNGYFNGESIVLSGDTVPKLTRQDLNQGLEFTLVNLIGISGAMVRPSQADDSKSLSVEVSVVGLNEAEEVKREYRQTILIASGEESAGFHIDVPPIENDDGISDYIISYQCSDCGVIADEGVYNATGTQTQIEGAQKFQFNVATNSINFELLSSKLISGTISRSNEIDINQELAVQMTVTSVDQYRNYIDSETSNVIIYAGDLESRYQVPVSNEAYGYTIRYSCVACSGIISNGFYSELGTVFLPRQADIIRQDQVLDDINLEMITARSIMGSVVRPDGVSNANAYFVEVSVFESDRDGAYLGTRYTTIRISANSNSAPFSLDVLPPQIARYRLAYNCFFCDSVVERGYYSSTGTRAVFSSAQLLAEADILSPINFSLLNGVELSGVVSRPSNVDLTEAVSPRLNLRFSPNDSNASSISSSAFVTIPIGSASATFSFVAPPSEDGTYRLSYGCSPCLGIAYEAYYSSTGTELMYQNADFLNSSDFSTPLEFEMLAARKISGSISRGPVGLPSQLFYLNVNIYASSEDQSFSEYSSVSVNLEAGQESIDYVAYVSPTGRYNVGYSCSNCSGFDVSEAGYYSSTGTTDIEQDTEIIVSSEDLVGVNMELLNQNYSMVTGTLYRPSTADITRPYFVKIDVRATDEERRYNGVVSDSFVIDAGESSVDFSFRVRTVSEYQISYKCEVRCDGAASQGYFNLSGTVLEPDSATILDSDQITGLTFEMLPTVVFSGVLNRSQDGELSEDLYARIVASRFGATEYDTVVFEQSLRIPAGEASAAYAMELPDLSTHEYELKYECFNCQGIVDIGYYSSSGTVADANSRLLVNTGQDLSSINLSLLDQVSVEGLLMRASGASLNGVIKANILVVVESGSGDYITQFLHEVVIKRGNSSVAFELDLPQFENYVYKIGYSFDYACSDCSGLLREGFISSVGTSGDRRLAQIFGLNDLDTSFNIRMEEGVTIDIELERPQGVNISQAVTAELIVEVLNSMGSWETQIIKPVTIEAASLASTTIFLPIEKLDSTGYRISYRCDDCAGILSLGYLVDNFSLGVIQAAKTFGFNNEESFFILRMLADTYKDSDIDGFGDEVDNCPLVFNKNQSNLDEDTFGDLCDDDIDGDGISNEFDSNQSNPLICTDSDNDQCDDCSSGVFDSQNDGLDTDGDGYCNIGDLDDDNDSVPDLVDNCPLINNSSEDAVACRVEDELCFPVVFKNRKASLICL